VALVVWLVRSLTSSGMHHLVARRSSGLDVLEERYARGEWLVPPGIRRGSR